MTPGFSPRSETDAQRAAGGIAAAYLGELWMMHGAPPAVAAAYLAGLGTMRGAPPEASQPPI